MLGNILLLFNLGPTEIGLIALVVLLLFGGRKIPELMRGLGKGIKEFNDAKDRVKTDIKEGMDDNEDEKEKKGSKKEVKGEK